MRYPNKSNKRKRQTVASRLSLAAVRDSTTYRAVGPVFAPSGSCVLGLLYTVLSVYVTTNSINQGYIPVYIQ